MTEGIPREMPSRRRVVPIVVPILAAAFIAVCFFQTAKAGRRMPYNDDDMMNLYFAWIKTPWQLFVENLTFAAGRRPLGAAFYRAQFALWGFRSQPLHGIVWTVLALNLWLAWRLFRRLGADSEAALLGVAILALHGCVRDLSYNTGTLYDTFCFTFYVAALLVYVRAREGGAPAWKALLLFGLLFACALNSKEMAVSLPLVVLLWELVSHPPQSWSPRDLARKLTGEWRGLAVSCGIGALFSLLALSSHSAVHSHLGYTPSLTWSRWVETTAQYLAMAFYTARPGGWWWIAVYAAAIAAAAVSVAVRARSLAAFGVLWFPITLLPISFITPRVSGYVLYLPLLLWALVAGKFLAEARTRLAPLRGWPAGVSRILLLFMVAAGFGALNRLRPNDAPRVEDSPIERTARQFRASYANLKTPSRLLFLRDPFRPDGYALLMTLRLLYKDTGIDLDRLSAPEQHPPLGNLPRYDHIFDYDGSRYVELDNTDPQTAVTTRVLPGQRLGEFLKISDNPFDQYVVKDLLEGKGEGRWTGADPEFRFKLQSTHRRKLAARIFIARETLRQNGPKEIAWFVNGQMLAHTRYEIDGIKTVSFTVPESWLSAAGVTTVGMHLENPYIAPDQVKLGVVLMEIGFR
jgi:hypothetical protein